MSLRCAAVASVVVVLLCPSLFGEDQTLRQSQLRGKWIVTRLVIDGTELAVSEMPEEAFYWEVDEDQWQYTFVVSGKRIGIQFQVTLTADCSDLSIDAELQNGAFEGGICKGICRVDGDRILLCLADEPSVSRPDRFEAGDNSGLQLFELKRVPPDERTTRACGEYRTQFWPAATLRQTLGGVGLASTRDAR